MPREKHIYVINSISSEVVTCHSTELCRNTLDGVTYITSTNLKVYISFPILDLHTGETDELWLDRKQHDHYRVPPHRHEKPHPRMWGLPVIGLPRVPDRGLKTRIEAFVGSALSMTIVQDGGGHWWVTSDRPTVVAHVTVVEGCSELHFTTPWVQHIGPDNKEMWFEREHFSSSNSAERVALCTRKVYHAITETGMVGHYFPMGKARKDPELATQQALTLKTKVIAGIQQGLVVTSEKSKEELEKARARIDEEVSINADQKKTIRTLQKTTVNLKGTIKGLEDSAETDRIRIEELLAELEEFRNRPFPEATCFSLSSV